jgi:hypothetical protein
LYGLLDLVDGQLNLLRKIGVKDKLWGLALNENTPKEVEMNGCDGDHRGMAAKKWRLQSRHFQNFLSF